MNTVKTVRLPQRDTVLKIVGQTDLIKFESLYERYITAAIYSDGVGR